MPVDIFLFSADCLISAAAVTLAITALRCELLGREGNPGEHLAGILGAADGIAAILGGNGVVKNRHDQLSIPLQPDDGELTQGHVQPLLIPGEHQVLVETAANGSGNLAAGLAAAVADILDFTAQHHGIQHLHHSGGAVGVNGGGTVGFAQPGIGAENVGTAVLTAEHCPL